MSTINDGGPAFPGFDYISQGGKVNPAGMSLRDYFAAAALQGMYANDADGYTFAGAAEGAYRAADAMLAEREKGGAK